MNNKSKSITKILNDFSKDTFARERSERIKENCCIVCGSEITGFRDELSVREYQISGMCQDCQDYVFGV